MSRMKTKIYYVQKLSDISEMNNFQHFYSKINCKKNVFSIFKTFCKAHDLCKESEAKRRKEYVCEARAKVSIGKKAYNYPRKIITFKEEESKSSQNVFVFFFV